MASLTLTMSLIYYGVTNIGNATYMTSLTFTMASLPFAMPLINYGVTNVYYGVTNIGNATYIL